MSRDLQEGPTASELDKLFQLPPLPPERPRCFACGNDRLPNDPPTIAVFVSGGLVQDVCFDGNVRVVVIDHDCDEDDDSRVGIFTDPETGRHSKVWAVTYERSKDEERAQLDAWWVRAAVKTATDPFAPFRDNEEERKRIQREIEESDDGC